MSAEMIQEKSCCFTGHRADKLQRTEKEVCMDLKQAILQAIDDGFTSFITGMAYGVDIWAGELVLEQRRNHPEITLIAAIPFACFESRWDDRWKKRYQKLLRKADEVHFVCDGYTSFAYQRRNEWMVDRSLRVIAVYNGDLGGTRNTINYAQKKNVPVVLLQG